jgi:hypothetical protein
VTMEHVLIQSTQSSGASFSYNPLMFIGTGGSVSGKNLTFFNTSTYEMVSGGCVENLGSFACTDCVFDYCSAGEYGGGVYSSGDGTGSATLNLVRPTFTNNKCGTNRGLVCGAGCYCAQLPKKADPSKCVGCTCKTDTYREGSALYCDSN